MNLDRRNFGKQNQQNSLDAVNLKLPSLKISDSPPITTDENANNTINLDYFNQWQQPRQPNRNVDTSPKSDFCSFDPHPHDYPFLEKIFQILFTNQNFFDGAFFDSNSSPNPNEQMTNCKKTLYHLMIKQLLADGYTSIAEALEDKIEQSANILCLSADDTLEKLFKIIFYIEQRGKTDVQFSQILNWFLSFNTKDDQVATKPKEISTPLPTYISADNCQPVIFETEPTHPSFPIQAQSLDNPIPLQVAYKFGQLGDGPGCLDTPHGFCLGIDDDIVIADTNNHRICVFTLKGQFKFSFGEYGTQTGKLYQPRKIAMAPPAILTYQDQSAPIFVICDRGTKRSRMQIFSTQGEFIRLIDIPSMDIVSGLTTTSDRKIIVVDSVRSGVLILNEMGAVLNWFTCSPYMVEPSDIAVHNKHFYICDFKGHCICLFNAHGILVKKLTANMLKFPNGIDVSDYGDIICGDSHGNRFHISVFNDQGQFVGHYDCPFVKVSRCCGLRLSREGLIVTLAKNNNHAVVTNTITIKSNDE